ncbi:MAG: XRE family transcriptional regulator [Nitrospinae bacterium]|nr:XRE family transcriptional regulator [Nitrospinota bacterium]
MKKAGAKNLFQDLGFDGQESANLLIRSNLMMEITKFIEGKKMTQAKAARFFGVAQPRISDLMRGKIQMFTVDTLISMLAHAGVNVGIVLSKKKAA